MNAKAAVQSKVGAVRDRAPWLDHFIRAWTRYQADSGDRMGAAVTFYGFLSFFPLVALAFSITGFIVDAYPSAQNKLIQQINSFLPGLSDKLNVASIGNAKVATGLIGLLGLLLAGLGWIDALRDAIRTMWHHNTKAGNFLTKKLADILTLAGLGLTVIGSIAITGVSSAFMGWILDAVGLKGSIAANVLLRVVGYVLVLAVDVALFLYLFIRLPRLHTPWRRVIKGAVFGAVGFELLKVIGSILVAHTTRNPVYGTFAVVVGLLIWINYVSRFTLFVAAWTVTAPYDTDVPPSGTADETRAEEAGIPPEYADSDPDHVPTTQGGGAPAPLNAVLQGETPPQDQPEGRPPTADGSRSEASAGGRKKADSGSNDGDDKSAQVMTTAAAGRRVVASPDAVRTSGKVGAGTIVAGAAAGVATVAALGVKALRGGQSGERKAADSAEIRRP